MDTEKSVEKKDERKVITLKRTVPDTKALEEMWLKQQEEMVVAQKHAMISFLDQVKELVVKGEATGLVVMAFGEGFPSYQMAGKVDGNELITISEIIKTAVLAQFIAAHTQRS